MQSKTISSQVREPSAPPASIAALKPHSQTSSAPTPASKDHIINVPEVWARRLVCRVALSKTRLVLKTLLNHAFLWDVNKALVAALRHKPLIGTPCILATMCPKVTKGTAKAARKHNSKVWKSKRQNLESGFGGSAVKKPLRFFAFPTYTPREPALAAFSRVSPKA